MFRVTITKQRIVLFAIIALIITAIGGFFVFLRAPGSLPFLSQKERLTVNDRDYKDPCNLLSPAQAQNIFGKQTSTTGAEQQYLQRSATNDRDIATQCKYYLDQGTLTVEARYYPNTNQAHERWKFPLDVTSGDYRKSLTKPTTQSSDGAIDYSASDDAFEQIIREGIASIEKKEAGLLTKRLGDDIVFVPYRSKFVKQYGPVLVTLTYNVFKKDFTATKLLAMSGKFKTAFDTIDSNWQDDKLSQDMLTGDVYVGSTLGKTQVLAPCEFMTQDTFKLGFGRSDDATARQEVPGPKLWTLSSGDKYVTGSCTRYALKIGGNSTDSDYAYLDIIYSNQTIPLTDEYKARFDSPIKGADGYTVHKVKTEAALALISEKKISDPSSTLDSPKFVTFYSGPYLIKLKLTSTRAHHDYSRYYQDVSDQSYVNAVNDIVNNIGSLQ
ncbi:hypothetical protein KDA23_05055 [Candidatus Saccharibacteria bacterium]|nr:hypothetical protein [Candidatus Saccharibacteria bacterium]